MASGIDWIILRPALVIAPHAHGGTALLRAYAALPMVALRVFPEAPIQAVSVLDLATAVGQAADDAIASRILADLCEARAHAFAHVVDSVRAWQRLPPWQREVSAPDFCSSSVGLPTQPAG